MTPSENPKLSGTFSGYLAIFTLIAIVALAIFAFITSSKAPDASEQSASAASALQVNPFDSVELLAGAAYVLDTSDSRVLFEKNSFAQLPLASVTKTMTALIANTYLTPDDTVVISDTALMQEGDSGFTEGESWDLQDLLDFTLMTSSNDGAAAIAEAIEAHSGASIHTVMNEHAANIGLQQTYFLNETGLDENEQLFSGAYGSARDVAYIFRHTLENAPRTLEATAISEYQFTNREGTSYSAVNTNTAIGDIPGLSASKTGFTDLAGGNLAVAFEPEPGHSVIVVVLGSTAEGRFDDVKKLVRASLEYQL